MKKTEPFAKNLAALIRKYRRAEREDPNTDHPIDVLVYSFLLWERSRPQAAAAYEALRASFIDYNDLRVSLPYEIAAALPTRDPLGEERAQRLRATLNHIYRLESKVTLEPLADAGKRGARKYLDGLDGIVPFVAARVGLLCYDAHAIPLDARVQQALTARDALDKSLDLNEAAAWLSRQVKAADARDAHHALHAAADDKPARKKASTESSRPSKKKASTGRRSKSTGSESSTKRRGSGNRAAGNRT